jgi:5'-nucleotidase (lipoprotein e(P4) family)
MMRLFTIAIIAFLLPASLLAQDTASNQGYRDYTSAVLWQQKSGEYRALAFQAYNFAQLSLTLRLAEATAGKKNCVVVDVDETVLDNSPFQGYEIQHRKVYDPKEWLNWTSKGIADSVPGARGFLRFAESKGVETFYLSNRGVSEQESTLRNLKELGFPYADLAHVLFKTTTSDKEPRRQALLENYNILLLCGDNLSDFSNVFYREGKNTLEQVNALQRTFGTRFVVLPNPMYGDWEKSIYKADSKTEAEKSKDRLEGLKSY